MVNAKTDGTATYGSARLDVADAYPNAPMNVGFS